MPHILNSRRLPGTCTKFKLSPVPVDLASCNFLLRQFNYAGLSLHNGLHHGLFWYRFSFADNIPLPYLIFTFISWNPWPPSQLLSTLSSLILFIKMSIGLTFGNLLAFILTIIFAVSLNFFTKQIFFLAEVFRSESSSTSRQSNWLID